MRVVAECPPKANALSRHHKIVHPPRRPRLYFQSQDAKRERKKERKYKKTKPTSSDLINLIAGHKNKIGTYTPYTRQTNTIITHVRIHAYTSQVLCVVDSYRLSRSIASLHRSIDRSGRSRCTKRLRISCEYKTVLTFPSRVVPSTGETAISRLPLPSPPNRDRSTSKTSQLYNIIIVCQQTCMSGPCTINVCWVSLRLRWGTWCGRRGAGPTAFATFKTGNSLGNRHPCTHAWEGIHWRTTFLRSV